MPLTRRRKFVLILVIAPVALVFAGVVALFTSAVQTFAARQALAGQGGVESVAVGLSGASVTGLRIERPGLRVSSPSFAAEAPLFDLARGRFDIRSVVARDIEIDYDPVAAAEHAARNPVPARAAAPAKPFSGILGTVRLPGESRIHKVDIAGLIRVAGPRPVVARFALSGGDIAAGGAGKLVLRVEADAGAAGVVVTTFELSPDIDLSGQLSSLALTVRASAQGGALKAPADLHAALSATREGDGERYNLKLATATKTLAELDTRWAPGTTAFPGTWKLALTDADLKPFLPPFIILPEVRLDGAGELSLSGTERLRASGRLTLFADALERLGLPALGELTADARFDLEGTASEQRVNAFSLALASGASPVLELETRQAFAYAKATGRLTPAKPDADLASLRLRGVPAAWWKPYAPDLAVAGPITAAFVARPAGEGFLLESTEPLRIGAPSYAEQAAFESLVFDGISVERQAATLAASVRSFRAVAGGVDVVSGDFFARQETGAPLGAKAGLRIDLAKLADQPAMRGKTRLAAGRAELAVDAALGDTARADLDLKIDGLRAAGVAAPLPALALKAGVVREASGALRLVLPVTVTNSAVSPARASDLELKAELTPGTPNQQVIAQLVSRELHVPDLQAFAALAADAEPAAKTAPPASKNTAVPAGPLWAGYTGRVDFDFKRIVYAPGIEFPNTKGTVAITPETLSLEKIQTVLGTGGSLDLSAVLRWLTPTRTYALDADLAGRDVAVGGLLRALDPATPPALEGDYSLSAKVSGLGGDPAAALLASAADIRLTGRQGVLRAIDLETSRFARAGNVVSGLAGLAGALSGNAQISERANQITALNNLARRLANLAYDEFALTARRQADGAVEIGELRLRGADVFLAGSGSLRALPGRKFYQQPLALELDLGARGDFARDLAILRVLKPLAADAPSDPAEFRSLTQPLVFDGTLQKIGTTQAVRFLTQALGL